jgi:DNA-binding CsgD family transcriptional regulator
VTPTPPPATVAAGTHAEATAENGIELLRRLRVAIARLRDARSVEELLPHAAAELCRVVRADGAALLRVDGDEAALQALFCAERGDISGSPLERPPFSLRRFAAESTIVRRTRAAITAGDALGVASAGRQPWAVGEMTCAAAPISAGGRVIGVAYAVWTAPSPAPGTTELEAVWTFTEALGAIVEDVWTLERLHLQLEHVRPLLMAVGAVLGEVSEAAISLAPASAETLPSALPLPGSGNELGTLEDLGLSSRELEVLALMSQGATNDRIAGALTVSIATVKSHVRTILRKLHASNRAEAASHYAARRMR